MDDVFISYCSEDAKFADKLCRFLRNWNVRFWRDVDQIRGGRDWGNVVQEALHSCKLMILIASSASNSSDNVADEWTHFRNNNKMIIPVRIEPVELNFRLNRFQRIDFLNSGFETAFEKLCQALMDQGVHVHNPYSSTGAIEPIGVSKVGNVFWLCHDMLELIRWFIEGIPKEWLNIGLRQSVHHATEIGLSRTTVTKLSSLRDRGATIEDWTPERRIEFASEATILFNVVAQEIQAADPNFDSGPG
jgi:hypothetical protein